jgi:transposase
MKTSYKKEFRAEAVRLAITGDKPISQTARDLGVNETTLYNWVGKARQSKIPYREDDEVRSAAEVIDELKQLRKENARLKEEREILKKAAVFFAKEEQKR